MLVIRRQFASNAKAFRDFKVHRSKITQALVWLKQNNRYYADIIIDHEILQSLPIDGIINDQLQDINDDVDYDENEDDVITHTFVPLPLSANREDTAIRNTLNRIQNENRPIMWPQINGNPVNEFQTPGYIACVFPTLYPIGSADLCAERIKDIKPAEYFRHLLQYKDRRFARYARWRKELPKVITIWAMANKIMRFGEGLRSSRQFWYARCNELKDMIKQIGPDSLIFFMLSATDLH
ncbi:unnamed protein product [Rhizophagus irregularis]|nr:unnamed protein product [Rhizophagus irregularis]